MEDTSNTNEPKTPSQPPTKRFMDIQGNSNPPTTGGADEQESTPTETKEMPTETEAQQPDEQVDQNQTVDKSASLPDADLAAASTEASDEQEAAPASPTAESIATTEDTVPEPTPDVLGGASFDTSDQAEQSPQFDQHEHPTVSHEHHNVPIIAVLLAIVVTLALCGLVIATFIKNRSETTGLSGSTDSTNSKTTTTKPQASPADVDQATSDIDSSLTSINEATDFSDADISDQSLGL